NTAFSEEEQLEIKATTIIGDNNEDSITDKIYLLSSEDACCATYGFDTTFNTNTISKTRAVKATDYSCQNGASRASSYDKIGNVPWLLRSPGTYMNSVAGVYYDGESFSTDSYVDCGIRPVIHIKK
ncbi:MAG: hypothetical protein IJ232_08495, partial [Lachnospiraceae bacterium]|nr:hypothetical protein [Lachnospiraceae bacterium]